MESPDFKSSDMEASEADIPISLTDFLKSVRFVPDYTTDISDFEKLNFKSHDHDDSEPLMPHSPEVVRRHCFVDEGGSCNTARFLWKMARKAVHRVKKRLKTKFIKKRPKFVETRDSRLLDPFKDLEKAI